MGATETLAQFITDTHYETLPTEVVSAAKIGLMDGVANMLAGATQPLAAVISTYVQQRHHIRAEDVASLELEVPAGLVRRGHEEVRSGLDGKFSFAYCGAVALAEGQVDIDSFSDATRFSPRVEALLPKVRIKPNPDIPTAIPDTWAIARVSLRDGRELSEQCRHYRGSIANPMSRDEHLSKVRACAQRSLQPADIERVISMIEGLETLPDLRQLMGILGHRSVS